MPADYTVRNPWKKVRDAVSSADDVMTAAGAGGTPKKNWSARDTTMGCTIPLGGIAIGLGLLGSVEDAEVVLNVYLYAQYGFAELVASATYTIGSMEIVEDPTNPSLPASSLLLADTIAFTDQNWPNDKVKLVDYEGDEGAALMWLNASGLEFLKVEVASISAGTATPIFRHWD